MKKVILIAAAEDMDLLRREPAGNYALVADIDLQGKEWAPLGTCEAPFSGVLNGNGHTVSNVKVTANTTATGFFGVNEGEIFNLNIKGLTIEAQKACGSFGAIVGENRGDICAVNVEDGRINLTCTEGQTNVGALVGMNHYLMRNCVADVAITVNAEGGKVCTGGIAGQSDGGLLETLENFGEITLNGEDICAGLFVGKITNTKLLANKFSSEMNLLNGKLYSARCGEEGVRTIWDGCVWRDNANSDRLLSPEELALRTEVEQHMRRMGSHPWTPDRRLEYICTCGGDVHHQVFEPGTTYYGIPYAHKHCSYEQFLDCFREDGKLQPWLKAAGWDAFDLHLGLDCSGAIYWAWSRVSPDLTYRWCGDMKPYKDTGIVKVGEYKWPEGEESTREVKELNGVDVIRDAMAKMHKGDVFLRSVKSGHVRMCARNPVIYRSPDGTVDSMSSYAITHEQGDGLYPKNREKHSSFLVDQQYSLRRMTMDDYLPISTPVLMNGSAPECWVRYEGPGAVNTGTVSSNYRITKTTVQVCDAQGAPVWEKSLYTAHNSWAQEGDDYLARTVVKEVDLDEYNLYWGSCRLVPGQTYTYRVCALLSTGKTWEAASFRFQA